MLLLVANTLFSGWCFMLVWKWFAIPLLGMKVLTFPQYVGLAFFINFILVKIKRKELDNDDGMLEIFLDFVYYVFASLYLLGIGWTITLFM